MWTTTGWTHTGTPCRYLDPFDKQFRVYSHRFQAEKDCIKVSPSVVLQGILPSTCAYVEELNRIVEEDYDGVGPQERAERKRERRSKRGRKR